MQRCETGVLCPECGRALVLLRVERVRKARYVTYYCKKCRVTVSVNTSQNVKAQVDNDIVKTARLRRLRMFAKQ